MKVTSQAAVRFYNKRVTAEQWTKTELKPRKRRPFGLYGELEPESKSGNSCSISGPFWGETRNCEINSHGNSRRRHPASRLTS